MARRKDILTETMSKLRSDLPDFKTVRVWNGQVEQEKAGEYVAYAKPACFVQLIMNPDGWAALPEGVSSADAGIVFHIVHEYYDAQDGTFEQDLPVFDLADQIIEKFTLFKPSGCGPWAKVNEGQDENHTNIYEYQVGFLFHFIDTAGQTKTTPANIPNDVQLTATFVQPKNFIIPKP